MEIKDASSYWGLETGDTQRKLKDDLNDEQIHIASIGPGGENLVRYACILNDLRNAAGRTGMGAVLGSKKLKAIVVKGKKRIDVANKAQIDQFRKKMNSDYLPNLEHFSLLGTGGDRIAAFVKEGNLSVRNFRDGTFETADKIDPRMMKNELGMKMEGCYACPIRCKKVVSFSEPWDVKAEYGGPEYESIGAFGSNCGIDDVKAICKANELCNRYGIDVISAGVTIGFAMECYERGLLNENITHGLEIEFGNAEALVKLVEMIAKREEIGALLAEGVKRVAEKIGNNSDHFAIHVKGLEVPMHEPRLKRGLGLGYTVSPTGADHMHNLNDILLTSEKSVKRFAPIGILEPLPLDDLGNQKVQALIYQTNWRVVYNSLVMCMFQPWNHSDIVEITRAITGWDITLEELLRIGERITTMARAFNIREGFTKKDDWLPERFFTPKTSGALANSCYTREELEEARAIYYKNMGWNKDGVPLLTKLEELNIDWVNQLL